MPRRAPIGNRILIERALLPDERESLSRRCRSAHVPRDDWQLVDHWNREYSSRAIANRAAELEADGRHRGPAFRQAAAEMGMLDFDVERLLADWRREWKRARKPNALKA